MRIAALECLHADAGHRNFDFLKVTTDDGLDRLERVQRILRRQGRHRRDPASGAGRHRQGPARLRGRWWRCSTRSAARPAAAWCSRRSARSRTRCSTSRRRRWASRSTRCSAARSGPASGSTGRIAGPIAWPGTRPMQIPPLRTLDDVVAHGQGGGREGLRRAQDQRLPAGRAAAAALAGLRAQRRLPGAQRRAPRARARSATSSRPSARAPGRTSTSWSTSTSTSRPRASSRWRARWSRSTCSGSRSTPATPGRCTTSAQRTTHPGRVLRMPVRPARLPALLRAAGGRRRDHRHALERGRRSP